MIAYSRMMLKDGWLRAAVRIYRRVWQLYVAHILLFVAFTAQIAYVSIARDTPQLVEEMQLWASARTRTRRSSRRRCSSSGRSISTSCRSISCCWRPFPLLLPALLRWPWAVLLVSIGLYAVTSHFNWNLPGYPDDKVWFFNPMAWQVVFYCGAVLAVVAHRLAVLDRWRRTTATARPCSISYLPPLSPCPGTIIPLERLIPDWFARQIYPIDKTNLDILRFIHFLALAWLVRLLCGQTPGS